MLLVIFNATIDRKDHRTHRKDDHDHSVLPLDAEMRITEQRSKVISMPTGRVKHTSENN